MTFVRLHGRARTVLRDCPVKVTVEAQEIDRWLPYMPERPQDLRLKSTGNVTDLVLVADAVRLKINTWLFKATLVGDVVMDGQVETWGE